MKQLTALFLALTLIFSSVGSTLLFGDDNHVEAKSYKSGKKGYNSSPNNNNNSNIQNKDNDTTQNTSTNKNTADQNSTTKNNTDTQKSKGGFSAGGLMKGLLIGGLAGLLFGSLFGDMGLIGSILGLLINGAAIALVVFSLVKIFKMITRKKQSEVSDSWKK